MKALVTGSAGHLGEALIRTLLARGDQVVGLDLLPSPFTTDVASVNDRRELARCMRGVDVVFHAATLHKPHVATHSRQEFVDTNVSGTLAVLEEAATAGVRAVVYTSTTSVYGEALIPPADAPAAWITEDAVPIPKNIYGVTKAAAEDLCALFARDRRLPCIVLRAARFFPEEDDDPCVRAAYASDNIKVNEYLYRRVDIEDVVSAHLAAAERAPALGFRRYVISATSPFSPHELAEVRRDAPAAARRHVAYDAVFARRGWIMVQTIDRIYVNERARRELGWQPQHDFASVIARIEAGGDPRSPLARLVGSKGYHAGVVAPH